MNEPIISFHHYTAGIGMKHITFYHEPDDLVSQGGSVVRIALSLSKDDDAPLGHITTETALDSGDIDELRDWLKEVIG